MIRTTPTTAVVFTPEPVPVDTDVDTYHAAAARLEKFFRERVVQEGECWIAQGHGNHGGYQYVWATNKRHFAHRWVYEQLRAPIPEGLEIDHLCRRPPCVNPEHLEPVTGAENIRRRYALVTHCHRGHEFTPENIIPQSTGRRKCRECNKIAGAAYRLRRRGAMQAARAETGPDQRSLTYESE